MSEEAPPPRTVCGLELRDRSGKGLGVFCNLGKYHLGRCALVLPELLVVDPAPGE